MGNAQRTIRGIIFIAIAVSACAGISRAQGSRKDDIVFNAQGRPMGGATVRVCTSAATGQPCSPLAAVYSDAALTQALANPLSTDGMGNYSFYAAPGRYMIEISGPGITTKQLPNVILPSDPSSPTFTTVTTTSGISAFSLSLSGNLTVNGSTSVTGSLSVGGAPVPSTGADNQWSAAQRFQGPIPYRDATAFGAVSSTQTFTATTTSGSPTVTINTAGDWANGQDISVIGGGAPTSVLAPNLAGVAISAISRVNNVVSATVPSCSQFNTGANAFVYVSGYTGGHTAFNGYYYAFCSGTTLAWPQVPAAGNDTAAAGTVAPGFALYIGTNPGSTTHTYNVASVGIDGGVSAKSADLVVSNDPATLTTLDANWLYFGNLNASGFPTNVDYYCVYDNGTFKGRAHIPAYKDDGEVWARNLNCPVSAPSSPTAGTLTAKVHTGAGTTSLTLWDGVNPVNAGASGSGLYTIHDAVPGINAALTAAKADFAANGGGGPDVILPSGAYQISRLVVSSYKLDVTGTITLTTHPIRVQGGGTLQGHGSATFGGSVNSNEDGQATIYENSGSNSIDGIAIAGGAGGNTVRGLNFYNGASHDVMFLADNNAGANGITVENVSGVHNPSGDCLLSESNVIFVTTRNWRCQAATITNGGSTNRYSFYLSNRWASGSWVTWDMYDTYTNFGDFYVDSLAPANLNGGGTRVSGVNLHGYNNEGPYSRGLFTVDAGCVQSPLNFGVSFQENSKYEDMQPSDLNSVGQYVFWYPRGGTTGCTQPITGIAGTTINTEGFAGLAGTPIDSVINGLAFGIDAAQGPADAALQAGETRFGANRTVDARPFWLNYHNVNGVDEPAGGFLLPAPGFFAQDNGAGATSCVTGTTYYFKLSGSDGTGWTKVDNTVTEQTATVSTNGDFIAIEYGPAYENNPYKYPKYRIWYSTTEGVFSSYVETTSQTFFNFTCSGGTTGVSPPAYTTAYSIKFASRDGNYGDVNWLGSNPSDLFGFGKTNPTFSVDAAGTVNADAAYRLGGKLIASPTAPTIASGFGSGPSVPTSNGTVVFTINVGTGGTATSGVITMPTAPTGWNCSVNDITAAAAHVAYNTRQTASSTTSVTVENQTTSTGAAVAWSASDILRMTCAPY